MKKFMFLILLLLTSVTMLANFNVEVEPESMEVTYSAIKSLFLPAILGQLLILFADARKHYGTPAWSWNIFFTSKAKPFMITSIGGILIYTIISYIPQTQIFIETLADSKLTEVTAIGFFGLVAGIMDGFYKPKKQ